MRVCISIAGSPRCAALAIASPGSSPALDQFSTRSRTAAITIHDDTATELRSQQSAAAWVGWPAV